MDRRPCLRRRPPPRRRPRPGILRRLLEESSQSQLLCESAPLFRAVSWRPPRASGDHGNGAHFASDNYQYKIVLKDSGEVPLAVVSDIDPKDAVVQLLMLETYSRSECGALMKIIQERVVDSDPGVDELAVILPIAWQASTQQHPVAYSSLSLNTSSPATSVIPAHSSVFDNIDEKRWPKKKSTTVEGPCRVFLP